MKLLARAGTVSKSLREEPGVPEPTGGTKMVRVNADVAEWLGAIYDVTGEPSAQVLDPMIRADLFARFKQIEPAWLEIKKARDRHRKDAE